MSRMADLRVVLRARGTTVSGLARASGIGRTTIHELLRERAIRPITLTALARALDVDPDDLGLIVEVAPYGARREP